MYAIDTLQYSKRLIAVGFTSEQAEAQAECLRDIFSEELKTTVCTKQDLQEVKSDLEGKINDVKNDLQEVKSDLEGKINDVKNDLQEVKSDLEGKINDVKTDLQEVKSDLEGQIKDTKISLIQWMVGLTLAQMAALFAMLAFIKDVLTAA